MVVIWGCSSVAVGLVGNEGSVGLARLPLRDPWTEKIEPRRDQRISSSILPRPESEGLGVPEEVELHHSRPVGMGYLESSSLTWRRAIVEAATRDAERVDTATQICLNKYASSEVYNSNVNGWTLFRIVIILEISAVLLLEHNV